jgi:hypothetical protein
MELKKKMEMRNKMNAKIIDLENIALGMLAKDRKNLSINSRAPTTFNEPTFLGSINKNQQSEAKPNYSKGLIEQYQFFNRWIFSPKRVFYPCSELDASPIIGFPDAEVVIMDKDETSSQVMKKHNVCGYIQGDVLNYVPEKPFDLIILLNPSQSSKNLTRHLNKGGYVLAITGMIMLLSY